jgi:hypothetical protein
MWRKQRGGAMLLLFMTNTPVHFPAEFSRMTWKRFSMPMRFATTFVGVAPNQNLFVFDESIRVPALR